MNMQDMLICSVSPMVNISALAKSIENAKTMMLTKASERINYVEAYSNLVDGGIVDGVAHVNIHGFIHETDIGWALWCDCAVPSFIGAVIERYKQDPACTALCLHFNTGGGAISAVPRLADKIFNFGKPTYASITEQCCSAGYWLASQCDTIVADRGAIVGALGVYLTIWDDSEALAKDGIKVHLVTTGELKGLGEWGVPLTEAQKTFLQEHINYSGDMFVADIKRKRTAFDVNLFSGAFWHAEKALGLGLIDDVLL